MSQDTGCETCKKRRVKCDGARPNCLQCQKSNRICFALMRSETKFAFVIERFISEGAIIPPRQGKKHVERRHTAGRDQFRIPKSPLLRNNLKNWIPQSLTTSLEDQAMSYYFQRHVMSTFDIVDAAQDHSLYLYLMWMQSQRDSSFCLAVLATAYCAFGKARKNDAASKASRIMYFQAISTIKKSLTNSSESCSNQTLLGTLVLSFYELISWNDNSKGKFDEQRELSQHKSRCFCHIDGASALLKARQQRDPLNERGLELDKLVRRQVIRSALHRTTGVPTWLENGAVFGESGLSLELDRWMIRVTRIKNETQSLQATLSILQKPSPSNASVERLIEDAKNIDHEMVRWTTRLAPEWRYTTLTVCNESLQVAPYDHKIHKYSSFSHAAVWNRYRAIHIILKSTMIDLFRLSETYFGHDAHLSTEFSITSIRDLINDVCASIPLCTGEVVLDSSSDSKKTFEDSEGTTKIVNATRLAHLSFPLHIIIENFAVSGTPYAQQQWIRNRLINVGQATNYSLLEKFAATYS